MRLREQLQKYGSMPVSVAMWMLVCCMIYSVGYLHKEAKSEQVLCYMHARRLADILNGNTAIHGINSKAYARLWGRGAGEFPLEQNCP